MRAFERIPSVQRLACAGLCDGDSRSDAEGMTGDETFYTGIRCSLFDNASSGGGVKSCRLDVSEEGTAGDVAWVIGKLTDSWDWCFSCHSAD